MGIEKYSKGNENIVDGAPSFCQYHITNPIICNSFMSLYAVNEDDLIDAIDAEPGKIYWCLDCFGPVKRRKGKRSFAHFYHLKTAPTCRLHSKTEDHLLAQLQIQKLFPEGEVQLERPFPEISRIADACWEKEKIVFEIQCSPITEKEGERRISDYRSIGYETVWLLDDKRYNKRVVRPAEEYLRRHCTYYLSIKQALFPTCYDQFEIFSEGRRVKKGKPLLVDLQKIGIRPAEGFNENLWPKQILQLESNRYFFGDRIDRALRNHHLTLFRWRSLEIQAAQNRSKPNKLLFWFRYYIRRPYLFFLEKLIKSSNRKWGG